MVKITPKDIADFQAIMDRWQGVRRGDEWERILLDAGNLLIHMYDRGYWDGLRDGRNGDYERGQQDRYVDPSLRENPEGIKPYQPNKGLRWWQGS